MSRTFWIILIIVAAILLIILLFAAFSRIKESLRHINGWVYVLIILLVLAVGVFAAVKVFGPAGNDSILSESVDGNEAGDAEVDTDLEKAASDDGTEFTEAQALEGNSEGDMTVYVRVRGDRITVGLTPFDDIEQFGRAMESLSLDNRKVCLVDNYAVAAVYHDVEKTLEAAGIRYSVMTDDEFIVERTVPGQGEDKK